MNLNLTFLHLAFVLTVANDIKKVGYNQVSSNKRDPTLQNVTIPKWLTTAGTLKNMQNVFHNITTNSHFGKKNGSGIIMNGDAINLDKVKFLLQVKDLPKE